MVSINVTPCMTNDCTIIETKMDGLVTDGSIDGTTLRARRFVLCNHRKLWAETRNYMGIYDGWEFVAADQDDFTRMPNNIPYSWDNIKYGTGSISYSRDDRSYSYGNSNSMIKNDDTDTIFKYYRREELWKQYQLSPAYGKIKYGNANLEANWDGYLFNAYLKLNNLGINGYSKTYANLEDYLHEQMENNGFYDYGGFQAFQELLKNDDEFRTYIINNCIPSVCIPSKKVTRGGTQYTVKCVNGTYEYTDGYYKGDKLDGDIGRCPGANNYKCTYVTYGTSTYNQCLDGTIKVNTVTQDCPNCEFPNSDDRTFYYDTDTMCTYITRSLDKCWNGRIDQNGIAVDCINCDGTGFVKVYKNGVPNSKNGVPNSIYPYWKVRCKLAENGSLCYQGCYAPCDGNGWMYEGNYPMKIAVLGGIYERVESFHNGKLFYYNHDTDHYIKWNARHEEWGIVSVDQLKAYTRTHKSGKIEGNIIDPTGVTTWVTIDHESWGGHYDTVLSTRQKRYEGRFRSGGGVTSKFYYRGIWDDYGNGNHIRGDGTDGDGIITGQIINIRGDKMYTTKKDIGRENESLYSDSLWGGNSWGDQNQDWSIKNNSLRSYGRNEHPSAINFESLLRKDMYNNSWSTGRKTHWGAYCTTGMPNGWGWDGCCWGWGEGKWSWDEGHMNWGWDGEGEEGTHYNWNPLGKPATKDNGTPFGGRLWIFNGGASMFPFWNDDRIWTGRHKGIISAKYDLRNYWGRGNRDAAWYDEYDARIAAATGRYGKGNPYKTNGKWKQNYNGVNDCAGAALEPVGYECMDGFGYEGDCINCDGTGMDNPKANNKAYVNYVNSGGYVTFILYRNKPNNYYKWKQNYKGNYGDYYITTPNGIGPNGVNVKCTRTLKAHGGVEVCEDGQFFGEDCTSCGATGFEGIKIINNDYLPAARAALYYLIANGTTDLLTDEGYRAYKNRGGYKFLAKKANNAREERYVKCTHVTYGSSTEVDCLGGIIRPYGYDQDCPNCGLPCLTEITAPNGQSVAVECDGIGRFKRRSSSNYIEDDYGICHNHNLVLVEKFNVGDIVRVVDNDTDDWKIGTVTHVDPDMSLTILTINVDDWKIGTVTQYVDPDMSLTIDSKDTYGYTFVEHVTKCTYRTPGATETWKRYFCVEGKTKATGIYLDCVGCDGTTWMRDENHYWKQHIKNCGVFTLEPPEYTCFDGSYRTFNGNTTFDGYNGDCTNCDGTGLMVGYYDTLYPDTDTLFKGNCDGGMTCLRKSWIEPETYRLMTAADDYITAWKNASREEKSYRSDEREHKSLYQDEREKKLSCKKVCCVEKWWANRAMVGLSKWMDSHLKHSDKIVMSTRQYYLKNRKKYYYWKHEGTVYTYSAYR